MNYSCWQCGIDVDEDAETLFVPVEDSFMPFCFKCATEWHDYSDQIRTGIHNYDGTK